MSSDKKSEVLSSRIKLEVPFSNQLVHNKHKEIFRGSFDKEYFTVGTGIESEAEEPGCEKFLEVNYEVSSSAYEKKLLKAIRNFFNLVQKLNFPHHFKGSIVIHTVECFTEALITSHIQLFSSALFFGNIQGGMFINHWEVSFDVKKDVRSTDLIRTDFCYDRNDIITVTFVYPKEGKPDREDMEANTGGPPKKVAGQAHCKITVTRSQIRRIIVDPSVNDSYGNNRVRLYFELNSPVNIQEGFWPKSRVESKKKEFATPRYERKTFMSRGREPVPGGKQEFPMFAAISDSPIFAIELIQSISLEKVYEILSRLRVKCGIAIEFATFSMMYVPIVGFNLPYCRWNRGARGPMDAHVDNCWDKHFRRLMDQFPVKGELHDAEVCKKEYERRRFVIRYLIECLLSRGAIVKDQLWLNEHSWASFLERIGSYAHKDFSACETALERLVVMIDERKRFGSVHKALDYAYESVKQENQNANKISAEEQREGYQRVRKLIFTPTRVIYVVPEMMMGNRVLRQYDEDGTHILRVSFRDDNNTLMRKMNTGEYLMRKCVIGYLLEGAVVAGRDFGYLGSSNSQMRDHGAYFILKLEGKSSIREWKEKHPDTPIPPKTYMPNVFRVRNALGKFEKIESVPKMMARLGQCFTQSRQSDVEMDERQYWYTHDISGGAASNLTEYTYSDGVGMISKSMAESVSQNLKYCNGKGYPSAYQVRYRGVKGMQAVHPLLDELAAWAKKNKIPPPPLEGKEKHGWEVHCLFRPSQVKFDGHKKAAIEIVKVSAPVPVNLNKPFINILDQTAEMQGIDVHRRMCDRIEVLLDRQMRGYASMMIDEKSCRNRLKELPGRIDTDRLSERAGFELSTEPFFRSLIKAAVKFAITKQLRKEQIQIPFHLGRSMLGIVDETSRLQYGQIFAQYTENISDKYPAPNAAKKILKGRVLLTKNPCIVPGDVRIFEAVDIPELRHLKDVIVFPQHGPRPHPDQMAGSDLDGDEYTVIWDPELFLIRNEEAFDFTADKRIDENVTEENVNEKMADFYLTYMMQDSVGVISNAFLHQSDLFGINSRVCKQLAHKNSQAVDFGKSGKAPEALTTDWTEDEKTGETIPPEKPERQPDFHYSETSKPIYESPRLIGRLFREIKTIEDVLRVSEEKDEQMEIQVDPLITYEGWEKYREEAAVSLGKYNSLLRNTMENYGIRTEAEIFSGCICEMRNRISDKDQDDMSFFNTNQMIETKVSTIFKQFREDFFADFGGWKSCTEKVPKAFADEENVFHRFASGPSITEDMKRKAVAFYKVCYERAAEVREKKLSFAWVAYDVIADIHQSAVIEDRNFSLGVNPLFKMLESHRDTYSNEHAAELIAFQKLDAARFGNAVETIKKYCRMHPGLDHVMFMCCQWAESCGVLSRHWTERHLCLLLILYCTNHFASINGDAFQVFEALNPSVPLDALTCEPEPLPDKSKLVVKFFEFLAARHFGRLPRLTFDSIGYPSLLSRGEWMPTHKSALKTYYNMVFNMRFDELPLASDADKRSAVIRECEAFVIELPDNVSDDRVQAKLMMKSGVIDVQLRRLEGRQNKSRVNVSARGTLESLDRLRSLCSVQAPRRIANNGKALSEQMTQLVFDKIMR